jgi:hypothetical protein
MPNPTDEYNNEAVSNAKAFLLDNPNESIALSSRLYKVNENTLRSSIRREKYDDSRTHGGQNKILSEYQERAIYKYVQDMYNSGFGATKPMVFAAICTMKEAEGRALPSTRWFRSWLSQHQESIKTTKTKVLHRDRVTAQDEKEVEGWFAEYEKFVGDMGIKRADVWNFDETGFQIGVTCGEEILVPANTSGVCIFIINRENNTSK